MLWDLPAAAEEVFVLETGVCPMISDADSANMQIMPKEMTNFFMIVVFIVLNIADKDKKSGNMFKPYRTITSFFFKVLFSP